MNYSVIKVEEHSDNIVEQVLLNRGIPREQILNYINPTADCIHPFNKLDNMDEAVKTVLKALANNHKIYLQIDSDCDGYTSGAVLLNYLHRVLPSRVENLISYAVHDKKHHGINVDNIAEDIKLVIVPDASSNEVEIHKQLAERGIEVVILDHHHAPLDETDPAIIVNNQMCDYPNKALSGVGIVYKFCKALDEAFKVSYADDFLDLVALGMIADMMDLRDLETRYYTAEGTKDANINNSFIKMMMLKNEFKIQNHLNPFTVSWYISPFINAMTRSGTIEEKQLLFRAMLEYEAFEYIPSNKKGAKGEFEYVVEQAVRTCGNVKARQEREKTSTLDMIYDHIKRFHADSIPVLIIQIEKSLDNNLNGLLANQIMSEFGKPTLILTKRDKEGVITWEGSARGFETEIVKDWRQWIEDCGCALYAEGHPFAFGVGFTPEGLADFRRLVVKEFSDEGKAPERHYDVDFDWTNKDNFDTAIMELAEQKDLWGQGVSEPLIALTVPVTKDRVHLQGKGTLKVTIQNSNTTCIKFGFGTDNYGALTRYFEYAPEGMMYITFIGYCSINDWNGVRSPQIEIRDYKISSTTSWYF